MPGMDAATGRPLDGLAHLRQSVRDILGTRIGTRVMRQTYGSDLPSLVDRPVNDALLVDLYAATVEALGKWEPRLAVSRVRAVAVTGSQVELRLEGTYRPDGRPVVLDGIVV
jgi:phage baseplate assembly protein W